MSTQRVLSFASAAPRQVLDASFRGARDVDKLLIPQLVDAKPLEPQLEIARELGGAWMRHGVVREKVRSVWTLSATSI